MTVLEVLRATRERLTDPANWCREASDGAGGQCIYVTMCRVSARDGDLYGPRLLVNAAADAVCRAAGIPAVSCCLWAWNRRVTHAGLLAALDRATAWEAAREQEFAVDRASQRVVAAA